MGNEFWDVLLSGVPGKVRDELLEFGEVGGKNVVRPLLSGISVEDCDCSN